MTVTYNFIMLFILHLIPTTHQQLFYYMQKTHMIKLSHFFEILTIKENSLCWIIYSLGESFIHITMATIMAGIVAQDKDTHSPCHHLSYLLNIIGIQSQNPKISQYAYNLLLWEEIDDTDDNTWKLANLLWATEGKDYWVSKPQSGRRHRPHINTFHT